MNFFLQVISLSEQLNFYKKVVGGLRQKLGDVESKKTLSDAVYLFSIGTNDYTSIFLQNSTILSHYSKSTYVGMVIGNLTIAIKVSSKPSILYIFTSIIYLWE